MKKFYFKTAEATGNSIGNEIADRITKVSKLVKKEAPPWLGAKCQKILKIRPPTLAKYAHPQCYIKLPFIAEIR